MMFFGIIAVNLLLLAIGFFIPVLIEYIQTGLVPKFPTLIVSGFAALAAIISYFSGLILNVLKAQNLQNFEIILNYFQNEYMKKTDQ